MELTMENVTENTSPPPGTIDEWNDEQWLTFKSWLKNILYTNIVEVIFTKTDGSERRMNCTLRGDLIKVKPVVFPDTEIYSAEETIPISKPFRKPPKVSEGTLRVFDLDLGEWRSFRVRNIKNIYTLILKYDKG